VFYGQGHVGKPFIYEDNGTVMIDSISELMEMDWFPAPLLLLAKLRSVIDFSRVYNLELHLVDILAIMSRFNDGRGSS
jgi:hypothetical protein